MKLARTIAVFFTAYAAGCSSGDSTTADNTAVDGGADTSASGDTAALEAGLNPGCSSDDDCTKALPPTTPADCATAKCNTFGKCEFKAKDADGDGFSAAQCTASGVTITTGDDCDDSNKDVYPGGACAAAGWDVAKGAVGECKLGKYSCASGTAKCEGAVGPAARDCTSALDGDCNGKPDNDTSDGFCACAKSGDTQSCTNPTTTMVGTPCGPGTQTCQVDPVDAKKLVWSKCQTTHVVSEAVGACGRCTYCNSGGACTPPGYQTCTSSDSCTKTNQCSCSGWSGTNQKLTVMGACGSCTYCPGSTACTPPGKITCTSSDSCTLSDVCSCAGWSGVNKRTTKTGAPGCSCSYCPGSDCTVPAPTKCPAGWVLSGTTCISDWIEKGVDIRDAAGASGTVSNSPPVAGATVYDSRARMDYVSGGCWCSDTYDAANVTCSGSGGSWGPLSQMRSGCNTSISGITVLTPVLWSSPFSCTFTRVSGWTPAGQGTCYKRGVLGIRWQVGATC